MEQNKANEFYKTMFKNYPDVIKVKTLKEMLPQIGKNKIYKLLQEKEIYSKKIGRDYYIPKVSIIEYLTSK